MAGTPPTKRDRRLRCGGVTPAVAGNSVVLTCRQIGRNKCTFCLGAFSCFLVVFVAATLQSLMEKAPLIFMREAESSSGQVDLTLRPDGENNIIFVNYTKLADVLAASPSPEQYSYTAPRLEIDAIIQAPSTCRTDDMTDDASATYGSFSYPYADDNSWMYELEPGRSCAYSCMSRRCDPQLQYGGLLHLIDTEKEARMGYGRTWEFGKIPAGHVVIRNDLASALGGVKVGDTIFVRMTMAHLLRFAFTPGGEDPPSSGAIPTPTAEQPRSPSYAWGERTNFHAQVALSLRVFGVAQGTQGKMTSKTDNGMFMEYDAFIPWVAERLHPLIRHAADDPSSASNDGNLYDFANVVGLNVPPDDRLIKYTDSNYDNIQRTVVSYANNIVYLAGFPPLTTDLPILDSLRARRFVSLYLGLLMNILLFIMFTLSCLLIYSLLLIDVTSRTFELAIRRMLGSTRPALVMLLVFQALAYSLPAWVLGLLVAQGITALLMQAFASISGLPVALGLTPTAVIIGTALALGVPLLASIAPIRNALATNLRDALDVYRPKSTAVKYTIERAENAGVSWSVVAIGTTLSVFGFSIYYLIPLSLLSLNLTLFFNIFFAILIGLLFGLVVLALNAELLVEKAVIYLTLFWERPVMRRLAISNLVAHRIRNRKTMVMYSLSIAFIVFLMTAANMEIRSAVFAARQEAGAVLWAESEYIHAPNPESIKAMEGVLKDPEYAPHIEATAWISQGLFDIVENAGRGDQGTVFSNMGHVYDQPTSVYAVSPGFTSATFDEYYVPGEVYEDSGLTVSEQLYTIRGSQSAIISSSYEEGLGVTMGETFLMRQEQEVATASGPTDTDGIFGGNDNTETTVTLRPLKAGALLDAAPVFDFSSIPGQGDEALVSITNMVRYTNGIVEDPAKLPLWRLLVRTTVEFEENAAGVQAMAEAMNEAVSSDFAWSVEQLSTDVQDLGTTQDIMNFLFATMASVALFLCFFSLMASMVTNIREQTKEAGVLRALGLTASRLIRVFVYEAYSLVMASSLMGVIIGVVVGWTFSQQRTLFTNLPVAFWVPVDIIVVVCIAAVVCSLIAAALPGRVLSRMQVTELLRTIT